MVAPIARVPKTSHGPIIQPMSVIHQTTFPAFTSMQCAMSCAAFTGNPQCVCTAPFGLPVVPLV
jgi:hypothetical protein